MSNVFQQSWVDRAHSRGKTALGMFFMTMGAIIAMIAAMVFGLGDWLSEDEEHDNEF